MGRNSEGLKIGIMGGTFDPIHYGHLMIAENAADQFCLDQVWFIPTGNPPHKETSTISDAKYRCDMLKIAISGNPKFSLSLREVEDTEVCYTCRTLTALCQEFPGNQFYFIMGADSLFEFETWRKPEIICAKAKILAAVRDHVNEKALERQIVCLKEKYQAEIYRLNTPNFSISSHNIRARVKEGKSIRYLLPENVRDYIVNKKLYLK